MKNLIKQAGFKSQKEIAKHTDNTEATISKWMRKPPRVFRLYILTKIEILQQRNKINRLKELINDRLL